MRSKRDNERASNPGNREKESNEEKLEILSFEE